MLTVLSTLKSCPFQYVSCLLPVPVFAWPQGDNGAASSICQIDYRSRPLCRCSWLAESRLLGTSSMVYPGCAWRTLFVIQPVDSHVPGMRDCANCIVFVFLGTLCFGECLFAELVACVKALLYLVQAMDLQQLFLAMTEDFRIIVVKLADRLHNMRTMASMPPVKQRKIALETIRVFAPLAGLLGLWRIKVELEDLSIMCDLLHVKKSCQERYKHSWSGITPYPRGIGLSAPRGEQVADTDTNNHRIPRRILTRTAR